MKLKLPNIYHSKRLKFLIAIPIVLMLISLYMSKNIVLDSSLSGGVNIVLQTNTSMTPQQIAGLVTAKIPAESTTVQTSPAGLQITLTSNSSLSKAYVRLVDFYTFRNNYSLHLVNQTGIKGSLQKDPSNSVLLSLLSNATKGVNASASGMNSSFAAEILALKPFVGNTTYNPGTFDQMSLMAQNAYANASVVYKNDVLAKLHSVIPFTSYSYEEITVQQSTYFLQQLEYIILIAFVLISIVVFFIFRTVVPSFAVIFGAANDIIVSLGAMAVFRIPLGIASIGGILMLLGYSMDTDVLTAIRILKRHEGTPEERAYSSMRTGLTMTMTAIVSFGVLFAVSLIAYVPTYYEIAGVVLCGLVGDVITTWFGNASMILLYVKHKEGIK